MISFKIHKDNMYNTLLMLSRNTFFYSKIKLPDSFETRIYLMFFHFAIMMIVFKKKSAKFNQKSYDLFFHNIENDLRELGFGDVTVNKKMKELNKILYDILLKIDLKVEDKNSFKISHQLISKYFLQLEDKNSYKFEEFIRYFINFYNFCFDISLNNMVRDIINFKN